MSINDFSRVCMIVSVPMPTFKFQVFHVGDGFEVVTTNAPAQANSKLRAVANPTQAEPQKVIQLRRTVEATNENICFMMTTGAGSAMQPKRNDDGSFEFDRGVLHMQVYDTPDGVQEFFPATIGMYTKASVGKGFQQCGCAFPNPALLLEAACANKELHIAGSMYVPSEGSETSPVELVCTCIESPEWIACANSWRDTNREIFARIKSNTLQAEQVARELKVHAAVSRMTTEKHMNILYGKLNNPVNINEVSTCADTSTFMIRAHPLQAIKMLEAFHASPDIERKDVVPLVRIAVHSAAELCASYQPIGAHGMQCITTQTLHQFLKASEKTEDRPKLFQNLLQTKNQLITSLMPFENNYANDNNYAYKGHSIMAVQINAEKMNLAGDYPRIHLDETKKEWLALKSTRDSLTSEQSRLQRMAGETLVRAITQPGKGMAGEAPNAALATVDQKLTEINQKMMQMQHKSLKPDKDCEDGSYSIITGQQTLKDRADFLYDEIKPYVAKGFLPLENMFSPGKVDTVFKSENDKIEAIHFIVKASLRLMSDALKWQSTPVNGTRYSYESCFALAAAPSLAVQDSKEVEKKTSITREQCSSFEELLLKRLENKQMAGHCVTILAKETLVKQFDSGVQILRYDIQKNGMMESTVSNVCPTKTTEKMDALFGNKNVNISIGGQNVCLQAALHSQARNTIFQTIHKQILSGDLGKEVVSIAPVNMEKGIFFYDLMSQIGGNQVVGAEITNEKNVTSILDSKATANALVSQPLNVAFCTTTMAWGACPASTKAIQTAAIKVPLTPEEDRRIKQIANELTPLNSMTKDHLAFVMNDMGRIINVGFEDGKFYGNDITGDRLDSETRIAHFFVLKLSEIGQSKPKYSSNPKGINAVLQSEMQAALPGLTVRVSQIENGLHVMQVVVDS